ncbi:MAG: integrase, partial [Boseongicola sp. SB0670_bin_30]|nr:integrase [Boseongicola sp. SB0670_bin_30]
MTLRESVERYVAWQRNHGAKFHSSAQTLETFCRQVGEDRDCDTVDEGEVRRFL